MKWPNMKIRPLVKNTYFLYFGYLAKVCFVDINGQVKMFVVRWWTPQPVVAPLRAIFSFAHTRPLASPAKSLKSEGPDTKATWLPNKTNTRWPNRYYNGLGKLVEDISSLRSSGIGLAISGYHRRPSHDRQPSQHLGNLDKSPNFVEVQSCEGYESTLYDLIERAFLWNPPELGSYGLWGLVPIQCQPSCLNRKGQRRCVPSCGVWVSEQTSFSHFSKWCWSIWSSAPGMRRNMSPHKQPFAFSTNIQIGTKFPEPGWSFLQLQPQ